MRSVLCHKDLNISSGLSLTKFWSHCKFSTLTSTPLYSSRLYAQIPVFEIVHEKIYLLMYKGNVQQNPLCLESSVTKDLPISLRYSPTIFYREA